jgi:hypothetical protein
VLARLATPAPPARSTRAAGGLAAALALREADRAAEAERAWRAWRAATTRPDIAAWGERVFRHPGEPPPPLPRDPGDLGLVVAALTGSG